MTDRPTDYWGARAAEYDDFIRRVVPGYDEMTARLLESLPPAPARILELGCGTGNLSLLLAGRFPAARLTLVDGAPEMVEVVRARLAEHHPRSAEAASFRVSTFEELELEEEEEGTFDLVVSSLSLHHLADPAPLYRILARATRPGGGFRNADGFRAEAPEQHRRHLERWHAFWREGGRLSEEEVRSVLDHVARHDHYHTLDEHFRMLREAGFTRCDCLWRDGLFGVVAAERASSHQNSLGWR